MCNPLFTLVQASTFCVPAASQTPPLPPPPLISTAATETQTDDCSSSSGGSSSSVQVSPCDIDGSRADAAVMAVADARCPPSPSCSLCTLASAMLWLTPSSRSVHYQTSIHEGSASVACGCDIRALAQGFERIRTGRYCRRRRRRLAAAAETIEELQQELVGGDAGSTDRHCHTLCQVHWVTLNDEYSQLLMFRLSGT